MGDNKRPVLLEDLGMQYATEESKKKKRYGLYRCGHCGKEFIAQTRSIKTGHTRSCGCLFKASKTIHGVSGHKFYTTWNTMKQRCTNISNKNYPDYGGRGITICDDWQDIKTFIEWAEATYIEGLSLDRIDNDKGYSPENCRWASKSEQAINQRIKKTNTSGFVGVSWQKRNNNWASRVYSNGKERWIGSFKTIEEAAQARDNYIIDNNLPHKLSKEYIKKEENDKEEYRGI